jgi:hypothetical protein
MKPGIIPTIMVLLVAALSFVSLGCQPQIIDIDPSVAREGMPVNILGANFGDVQGGSTSTVTFNGVDAGAAGLWGVSKIEVNVPGGATSGDVVDVVVSVGGKPSNGYPFYVPDLATCLAFTGGDFNLEIYDLGKECISSLFTAGLILNYFKNIDLSSLNPVELPGTSDLPIPGFSLELPFVGTIGYGVDLGVDHCTKGSGGATQPITIDLDTLTGGEYPCTIEIDTMVSFTMDPITEDTVWLTLMMEVGSIEGEECPFRSSGCTIALEIRGDRAEAS